MLSIGLSWDSLLITAIIIVAYLGILGVFVLIKRAIAKKKFDKEKKENENKDKNE